MFVVSIPKIYSEQFWVDNTVLLINQSHHAAIKTSELIYLKLFILYNENLYLLTNISPHFYTYNFKLIIVIKYSL